MGKKNKTFRYLKSFRLIWIDLVQRTCKQTHHGSDPGTGPDQSEFQNLLHRWNVVVEQVPKNTE